MGVPHRERVGPLTCTSREDRGKCVLPVEMEEKGVGHQFTKWLNHSSLPRENRRWKNYQHGESFAQGKETAGAGIPLPNQISGCCGACCQHKGLMLSECVELPVPFIHGSVY